MFRAAPRRPRARTAAGTVALLAVTACSVGPGASGSADSADGRPSGTVTVFAAASLEEAFTTLGERFEDAHPGTEVRFSFGGSDSLAASVTSGAPADVFAAASERTMETVRDADATSGAPRTFARNRLTIATAPGNPHHLTSLADLTGPRLKVALCAAQVPCGSAAEKALHTAGVDLTPVSYERDVRGALTKVELGEVDAALVYRTDVRAAGKRVAGVSFPEASGAVNRCPIAVLDQAPNAEAGRAFVRLVTSPEGRRVLTAAGFEEP